MLSKELASLRLRLKYEMEFNAHFANFISELTYDNIHTHYRAVTQDLLFLVEDDEWMFGYVNIGNVWEVIEEHAYGFQRRLGDGQLPIVLLSEARQIFLRRQKRLRKLSQGYDSRETSKRSESQVSKTVDFLGSSLQKVSFSNYESSQQQSIYGTSVGNVYSDPSSNGENVIQSKKASQKQKEHQYLKWTVQSAVKNLILEFSLNSSKQSISLIKQQRLNKYGDQDDESSTSYVLDSSTSVESEIESAVRAELKKYKIGQLFEYRTSVHSQRSHTTVRGKAEKLLRSIQSDSYGSYGRLSSLNKLFQD